MTRVGVLPLAPARSQPYSHLRGECESRAGAYPSVALIRTSSSPKEGRGKFLYSRSQGRVLDLRNRDMSTPSTTFAIGHE